MSVRSLKFNRNVAQQKSLEEYAADAIKELKSQLATARTENKRKKLISRITEWEEFLIKGE